jgi:hypothetical protein
MTAITYEYAKKTFFCITQFLTLMVMLDMMLLFLSLAQIASGDQGGYWNPFWQSQARMVLDILK